MFYHDLRVQSYLCCSAASSAQTSLLPYLKIPIVYVVKTILEEPVGEKVYGRDIAKKISFNNNDLSIAEYISNVEQKVRILCELLEGDIPEFPSFGRRKIIGENFNNYSYPELARDIEGIFMQDDLFESVEFVDIRIENGDIYVTLNITTKYQYATQNTIRI